MTKINRKFDTLVIGLGKTGFSCAQYLAKQDADFAVVDSRLNPPMLDQMIETFPNVPLYLGSLESTLLTNANRILISPGVSLKEPAVANAINAGIDVYGDIELFCRNTSVPIIAITGSNGKSTVATLVIEMLQASNFTCIAGGNLGLPALDMLTVPAPDFYVLELSSFQLETVQSLNAEVSIVLNIMQDHMDRYDDVIEYIGAKERIYKGTSKMIINFDDTAIATMIRRQRHCIGITLSEPENDDYGVREYNNRQWLVKGTEKLIPVNDIKIKGQHNVYNAMVAIALAEAVNCPLPEVLNVLRIFKGLDHRCQLVCNHNNIAWINDSKGTNVGASCAAIMSLSNDKNIILLAGGDAKNANFLPLRKLSSARLKSAIVFGKDGQQIATTLGNTIPVYTVNNIDKAVETAANIANSGDIVLMSPACSSHDMFVDYQQRGETFIKAVHKIVANVHHV